MNQFKKRFMATALCLLMVLSVLFVSLPSDAYAKTGTLISNYGTRHDYNVGLTSQALAYYTGEYTWENLSALQGGNENCLYIDNPLFEALHDLMEDTMTNSVSYKSLTSHFPKTDANNSSTSCVLFYTDTAPTSSNTISREHVWPKSHASFHESRGGADLHHLRPADSHVNTMRSNTTMGNVRNKFTSYKTEICNGKDVLYYTGTSDSDRVEVNDNIKGDVARILLYVWCRWEEPNLFMNTPNPVLGSGDKKNDGLKVIESLDTLLEWCKNDPVDAWEMCRNDQVENVQGNRNVFIDYPEFAWLVFGLDVPTDLDSPSNNASSGITGKPSVGGSSSGSTGGNGNTGSTGSTGNATYKQTSSLKDGDQIVIVNPASNKALSAQKTGYQNYYNAGISVSSNFSTIGNTEIYTAKKNSDGTWCFTSLSGSKLALAAEYSSLNDSGTNDRWKLEDAGNGEFYLLNVGREQYLEWYASKENWSTHKPETMTSDYALAFYVRTSTSNSGGSSSGGSSSGGSSSGTTPPATQPSTPATQPGTSDPATSQPNTSTPADDTPNSTPDTTVPSTSGQPAPLPTNPVTPPTVKHQNNTGTVLIIVAIVIVVLLGGAAVWYFVIRPKKQDNQPQG